ncbi:Voltage-gated potassium channel Kch [Pseudobythopirellula maris]|uniref:Voltage-gated potassium channel Kch n=1 Tax=Pseudobythopirellula maris TaxID=2527991 RepID=A0A5C5ZS52_9BACT|nr:potassium channel protein [Pseudobythopirellula maris]TWT90046.1 Voltage-gated potassium channel Kch [Pseudobythopirellula maris]
MARHKVNDWRDAEQRLAVGRCVGTLVAVLLIGTLGFHLIEERWTFWESFYFTLVTITTVGYGDYGLSEGGQQFAALLLLCGIGTFTYSLTTLVTIASDQEASTRRKMKKHIAGLEGHIIVCGYGRMGQMIIEETRHSGLECVVIERDDHGYEHAQSDGLLVIHGVASEDEILLRAGIERARGVVCAVDSDAENMFITVTARDLNPRCRVISRAESVDASRKLERAGAAMVVSPHQMAGKSVAAALLNPRLTRFLNNGEEDARRFELGEVEVAPGAPIIGQSIHEFGAEADGVVFVAIERKTGQFVLRPRGCEVFDEGDVVIFAGAGDGVDQIREAAFSEPVCV